MSKTKAELLKDNEQLLRRVASLERVIDQRPVASKDSLRNPVDAEPTAESPDTQADPRHGPPTRSLRLDASVESQRFVEDAPPGGPGALLECSTLSATPRVPWRGLPAPSPEPCLTGR